ncbi:MAG: GNAT family N-acetyltransferase [Oscillospiraceae bacterium]
MSLPTLKTSRLILRPLTREDIPGVHALTCQPAVARTMHFHAHEDPGQTALYLEPFLEGAAAGRDFPFAIHPKQGGPLIGVFILKRESTAIPRCDMTIFFSPAHWGKGLCTEVLQTMTPYAFETLAMQSLQAYVVGENTGSRRALERCGFHVDRVLQFDDCPDGLYVYRLERAAP